MFVLYISTHDAEFDQELKRVKSENNILQQHCERMSKELSESARRVSQAQFECSKLKEDHKNERLALLTKLEDTTDQKRRLQEELEEKKPSAKANGKFGAGIRKTAA